MNRFENFDKPRTSELPRRAFVAREPTRVVDTLASNPAVAGMLLGVKHCMSGLLAVSIFACGGTGSSNHQDGSIDLDDGGNPVCKAATESCTSNPECCSGACGTDGACQVVAPSLENILWDGRYQEGNLLQWHRLNSDQEVLINGIPEYGRPIQYGGQTSQSIGNGELFELCHVTGGNIGGINYSQCPFTPPGSDFAAKLTVKNSANGSEPADCDPAGGSCVRRRSENHVQATLSDFYDAIPYLSERWFSISYYVPANWDSGGSSWGPLVYQIKARNDGGGMGPAVHINLEDGQWQIQNSWQPEANCKCRGPWWYRMEYSATRTPTDLLVDFPEGAKSRNALNLTKGAVTDWIFHIKFDAKGSGEGGTGFLRAWNRVNNGDWVHVLDVKPKVVTIGGATFDHGIGQNQPPAFGNNGGFGIRAGMYMAKEQVWGRPNNRVIYHGNIKLGNENASCVDMTPDASDCTKP